MFKFVIKGFDCYGDPDLKYPEYIKEYDSFEELVSFIENGEGTPSLTYFMYFRDYYSDHIEYSDVLIKWDYYSRLKKCKYFNSTWIGYNFRIRPQSPFSAGWDLFFDDGKANYDAVAVPIFYEEVTNKYLVVMPEYEDAMPYGDFSDDDGCVYMDQVDTEFLGGHYVKQW